MKTLSRLFPKVLVLWGLVTISLSQELPLSELDLGSGDPIYTIYAADLHRSSYMVDEGYRLRFRSPGDPLAFETDSAGALRFVWKRRRRVISGVDEYRRQPRIKRSFADSGSLEYSPLTGVEVRHDFSVLSSSFFVTEVAIRNQAESEQELELYVVFDRDTAVEKARFAGDKDVVFFSHEEPPENWSETKLESYEPVLQNSLLLSRAADSWGSFPGGFGEALAAIRGGGLAGALTSEPRTIALGIKISLKPGRLKRLRVVRGVGYSQGLLWTEGTQIVFGTKMERLLKDSTKAYAAIPRLRFSDPAEEQVYWQSFTLMHQMMMKPEASLSHNYYLFSREPTWGWGHDGQVFHESLSMLAYVHMNPEGAMESQRVFMQKQSPDGYIPYRVGPYVARDFPTKGRKTSSAPFFTWINWEIYDRTRDIGFLEDAYETSRRYLTYMTSTRDRDSDGLYEWGGHAVLESVRDDFNVIWNLLGDKPESPSGVEALGLNSMLVREMKSLARLAEKLELPDEGQKWRSRADALGDKINATMWDSETGFYYHVDRDSNTFRTRKGVDLRRMEIVGFLPLWAGIVPADRMEPLLRHLKDPEKFWRRFGVPTLAADDPAYDAKVDRCCKWNGAVWLPWNYLVFRGLLEYGQRESARELLARNTEAVLEQLRRSNLFFESYSPDLTDVETHGPYIWSGILARAMLDLETETAD